MSFQEADTESFYDKEDEHYRSFWDEEGSLHWGHFESADSNDFIQGCRHWRNIMFEKGLITSVSKLLDLGCGNGTNSLWLAEKAQCQVTGIDLSGVRVENAKAKAAMKKSEAQFIKASATELPFSNDSFTHVWSQATLYHVHERERALVEVHRVLEEGGLFLFDDLVTPTSQVSELGKEVVYDRLLFSPTFSQEAYVQKLKELGFVVYEAIDLSWHLKKSYELLSLRAKEKFPDLAEAYVKMCEAIDRKDVGWSFFLCEKVSDRLNWIYSDKHPMSLKNRYNAWSAQYDRDLDASYRICPQTAAKLLGRFVPSPEIKILDAGCGTGMCGEELNVLGFKNVVGIDLSPKMLKQANQKNVYQSLFEADLETGSGLESLSKFDAIISTGVFTHGHVKPSALTRLDKLLKPSGIVALTFRLDFFSHADLQTTLAMLPWTLVYREDFTIFGDEKMCALVFQKKERDS